MFDKVESWEIHQAHYGIDEGRSKLFSSHKIAGPFNSREETWAEVYDMIRKGSDPTDIIVRKPDALFMDGQYPSFYDSTPTDPQEYRIACREYEQHIRANAG